MGNVAVAAPMRSIHGVVLAAGTKRPIEGATVMTPSGDIAATDLDGYFQLDVPATEHDLSVEAVGYASHAARIMGDSIRIELAPTEDKGETIEIQGKAPEQTKSLSYTLTQDEIRILPGAGNDALRAAQALPGVGRIPYGFGGLVLRGTSPRDTSIYIDGIEVPMAFHFGGMTSFYPSSMLSDLTLTAGGFDASYGRAQGGLVTLTTREPRTDKWRVGGSAGLLDSSLTAEGPVAGGGLMIGLRGSYFAPIVDPFVADDIPLPTYWDGQIRGSFGDPAKLGRVNPMVFFSRDHVANHLTGLPGHESGISINSLFIRAAAPYLKTWGPLTLHIVPWVGMNKLSFSSTSDGQSETFTRPFYPGGLRADLTRDTSWGHLRGGLDAESGYLSQTQVGDVGRSVGPAHTNGSATTTWTDLAFWGEGRLKLDGERFAIKPGLRVERYGLTGEVVVDPRVNIHEQLTDTLTLRESLGRFHQPPTPGDVDPVDGNPNLKSSYIDQASIGIDREPQDGWVTSLTGFYNSGHNLGVSMPTPGQIDSSQPSMGGLGPTFELLLEKQLGFATFRENVGRMRSYGAELMVKRHVGRWFGLASYTWSKSQRTDAPTSDVGSMLSWHPFELDQRHNLNLAGSVELGAWRLGARMQLVSGNPYSPSIRTGDTVTQVPFGGTLPMFFQLDLRADRRWSLPWGALNLYLDIQNVTNRRNVEGREFTYDADHPLGYDKDIPGLPLVPFVGLEFIPR